jgi:hypothetical protein
MLPDSPGKLVEKLKKTLEKQVLPMDYQLGQLAQTIAKLTLSDHEVGMDATIRMMVGDATMKYYTHEDDKDQLRVDKFCRKPFRHPKLKIQCPSCKLWGHDDTT